MTDTRLLSEQEFAACFSAPMRDVTADADPQVDIWPYVDALDLDELAITSINDVQHVYRDAEERFDQVLLGTGRRNTMLVILVDLASEKVHGHHLLDLNERYGIEG